MSNFVNPFLPVAIAVPNGNFDFNLALPPQNWLPSGAGSVTLSYDITTSFDGVRSLKMVCGSQTGGIANITQFPVTPGVSYILSAAMKSISGDPCVLQLKFFDINNNLLTTDISASVAINALVWVTNTLVALAPPNASYAVINLMMNGASGGTGEFDQVVFASCNALAYYLGLFTSKYKTTARGMAWAKALLRPFIDTALCSATMWQAFNLNPAVGPMAVGVQLDTIGAILGQPRTVGFQPSGGVSPVLDDNTYRTLLLATIIKNQWNGQIDSLYPLWAPLFPGGRIIIQDNQNMTATIIVSGTFTSILQDLITNGYIIPRPEGVQYTITFATLPIFGADLNNAYIAGADLGHAS